MDVGMFIPGDDGGALQKGRPARVFDGDQEDCKLR